MEDHKTVTDDSQYDITFHPAWASKCVVTHHESGEARTLYAQDKTKPVDVRGKGHPKKHTILLKGKDNKRNVKITVEDPEHSLHSLTFEMYSEDRDPTQSVQSSATETVMLENSAITCPPYCDPI